MSGYFGVTGEDATDMGHDMNGLDLTDNGIRPSDAFYHSRCARNISGCFHGARTLHCR